MRLALCLTMMVACGGGDPGDSAVELGPCEGGGVPLLDVGDGGMSGFSGWADGDTMELTLDSTDAAGFRLEFSTEGLDTNEQVSAVVALTFPTRSNSETYLAALSLQCDEGPGWAATFAPLPDDVTIADVDAATVDMAVTITDHRGVSANTSLSLSVRDAS